MRDLSELKMTVGRPFECSSPDQASILGPRAVPFAENGLGDQLSLDISTTPAPVELYYHEGNAIVEIAPSFEQLIDRLERHREVDEQSLL